MFIGVILLGDTSSRAIGVRLRLGNIMRIGAIHRSGGKTAKNRVTRAKKILGNYGASGLLEDLAIGYFGSQLFLGMGYPLESAMPMTRVAQGAIGKALNRRGKGRLAYGLIDLIDVYLIKQGVTLTQ
ncbi:unnamed protein product, partial [marine sediment metagenome]